jgi:hypothetical protein
VVEVVDRNLFGHRFFEEVVMAASVVAVAAAAVEV